MRALTGGLAKVLAGLALCAAPMPVIAQQQPAQPGQPRPFTPEDDILCAVWSTVVLPTVEDKERQRYYLYATYFFLGRFEGQTDKQFAAAMDQAASFLNQNPAAMEELNRVCPARMNDLVGRLQAWTAKTAQGAPARQ